MRGLPLTPILPHKTRYFEGIERLDFSQSFNSTKPVLNHQTEFRCQEVKRNGMTNKPEIETVFFTVMTQGER